MTRYGRLVELWAAISISLVLIGIVGIVWFTARAVVRRLVPAFALYILLEAAFRRRLAILLSGPPSSSPCSSSSSSPTSSRRSLVIAAIIGLAVLTLVDNVREIRRS